MIQEVVYLWENCNF